MADSRKKNVSRNIIFAFLRGLLNTILPFVTRTVTLYLLGEAYLGLGTLFTSILSMLSLTDLGLSSAITYTMYKPIAEGDTAQVSAILRYYRRLYRIIGSIVLLAGSCLLPTIPYLIKGEAPSDLNIYMLYYIYLINTVISYFFAGYRQCLLTANQRTDILSKITMGVYVCNNVFQVIALAITRNYYVYAFVPILGTLCTNFLVAIVTKSKYPTVVCSGKVTKEYRKAVRKRLFGLFGTKLNSLVVHQADTLIISAFLGLTILTEYGNYYFILNAVCAFTTVFFSSFTASIGNKLVEDGLEENYSFFKKLNSLNSWLIGLCSSLLLVLTQPFMLIWVGERLMQPMPFVVLYVGYFYSFEIQRAVLTYKDAAGLWYEDRFRPYVTMVVNIVTNLVLVGILGIDGVIISSIVAFCISIPWTNAVLFKVLFKRSARENLLGMLRDFTINVLIAFVVYCLCLSMPAGFFGLLMRFFAVTILFNIGYYAVYRKNQYYRYWVDIISKTIQKFYPLIRIRHG